MMYWSNKILRKSPLAVDLFLAFSNITKDFSFFLAALRGLHVSRVVVFQAKL